VATGRSGCCTDPLEREVLKDESNATLILPLRVVRVDGGDGAVVPCTAVGIGETELRMGERIERFETQLDVQALKRDVSEHGEIEVGEARTADDVARRIPEVAGGRLGKCGSVEPLQNIFVEAGGIRITDDIGALGVSLVDIEVVAARDAERESALECADAVELAAADDGIPSAGRIRADELSSAERQIVEKAEDGALANIVTSARTV
jgi:hypothetical protein